MKTNFMIVTTHEMRTPLTVLLGYMDALHNGYLGEASPAQAEAFEVCRRSADRMVAAFGDILEMLQIGERRVALHLAHVEVGALVREVVRELAPFVERRRQQLAVDAPEDLPPVEGDRERLRLILQNLLQNAIKFTPDECSVGVRVTRQAEGVQVTVEDQGIGIDAEELERIFEAFYSGADARHHHSGTFEFGARGVGLGLAIARGHVKAHGGRIWAESPGRGCGSRFHLLLPFEAPAAGP